MPRREDLVAAASRELRAAVATQRRRSDTAGTEPAAAAESEQQRRRSLSESDRHQRQLKRRAARQETVSRWLYPLSDRGGTQPDDVWDLGGGRQKRMTLQGFGKLIRSKHLGHAPWCMLMANDRRIKTGDFVYVYAEDDDAGIVGFATVAAVKTAEQGGPAAQLRIDFRLSERLVNERPVPASALRRWLRPHKRPVENLTAFSHRLDLRLSRFYGHAGHLRRMGSLSQS